MEDVGDFTWRWSVEWDDMPGGPVGEYDLAERAWRRLRNGQELGLTGTVVRRRVSRWERDHEAPRAYGEEDQ